MKPYIEALKDIEPYQPQNHSGTTNRRLVSADDCPHFEMVHGRIEAGGIAQRHFHQSEYQAMYVLAGVAEISLDDGTPETVTAGSIVRLPPGLPHQVKSLGPDALELLIVYAPPLARR